VEEETHIDIFPPHLLNGSTGHIMHSISLPLWLTRKVKSRPYLRGVKTRITQRFYFMVCSFLTVPQAGRRPTDFAAHGFLFSMWKVRFAWFAAFCFVRDTPMTFPKFVYLLGGLGESTALFLRSGARIYDRGWRGKLEVSGMNLRCFGIDVK